MELPLSNLWDNYLSYGNRSRLVEDAADTKLVKNLAKCQRFLRGSLRYSLLFRLVFQPSVKPSVNGNSQ